MIDETLRPLLDEVRRGQMTRRQFVGRASALGFSLTAIGAALRSLSASAQEKSEIVFWTSQSAQDLEVINMIGDEFNKLDPNLQVKVVQVPGSETDTTKLMTAVRGGTGPDVYMLDRFIVAQRAAEGVLQDITDFASGAGVTADQYVPFAWTEANYNGKLYALPFDTDARAIYYNKTMLQDAGIDPAQLDIANGPVTFETIDSMAAEVDQLNQDGNFSQLGFVPWMDQGWHYTWGFAAGGTFFDEAACEVTPANEGVVAGHQFLYDFAKARDPQKVNAFIGNFMLQTFPPQNHPFITKTMAMVVTGNWFIDNLENYGPDIDYGITFIPVPSAEAESATWAGGWSTVIPQGAKNVEGGFEFMKFFCGEQGLRIHVEQRKSLPTLNSLLADASLFAERQAIFANQLLPTAKNRPPLPVGAKYWDELTSAWQKVYLNESEPEAALTEAHDRVQPQLSPFCPITIG
jgi:multiple sugar transport system substrate-binding protein